MKEIQDIDLKALIEAETGQRFNKDKKICSPFTNEDTPSFSIFFNSNANKWQYKDFSNSGKYGDAIDFIMEYKNLSHKEAREYLGMEVTRTPIEEFKSTIEDYVSKQVKNGNKKGYEPLGTFVFVDENNNPIYAKVKFLKSDGKKETPYYSLQDGQVYNKRLHDEVPYNYYNLLQGIAQNKTIVFLEGEKDVNTINNTLSKKDYVATSIKGFKDYSKIQGEFMKIAVIGDTGTAGQKYVDNIKFNFLKVASSFKIINLPGIKSLGDNKDVTDWLEAGHTKEELLNAFRMSLDLKNKKEFQQDDFGIYSTNFDSETKKEEKSYITNFSVIEASKGYNIDKNEEQIVLRVKKRNSNRIVEKIDSSMIFSDPKTFKKFLGLDFSFYGERAKQLTKLKDWIVDYFATEEKEIYEGSRFIPLENGKFELVTLNGAISPLGTINNAKISTRNSIDLDTDEITKEELQELMQHLFRFLSYSEALCIIGSVISYLEVGQNIAIREKLHHLCLFGEAQSGKSTILENIIAPLLNYNLKNKIAASSSKASLNTICSSGNYPVLMDEYKPSDMTKIKVSELSDFFRLLYDRTTISKGNKDFSTKDFCLERPLIMCGEEVFANASKSLMTRCCIVTMAESQQTKDTTAAIRYLIEHEELLKKLGKSLILQALNLPIEDYRNLREQLKEKFSIKARPLNTCVNISCGIELLNSLLVKHNLQPIEDYYQSIESNMRETVLEGAESSRSVIERMILLFNDILQDSNYMSAFKGVKTEKGKTYIRSQILVDTLHKYNRDYQSVDITILKIKDFRTQAKKAGYIIKNNAKQFTDKDTGAKPWYDEYDTQKLVELEVGEIVECDLMEEAVSIAERNIFSVAR
ncbi:CHC2 zinc finger domain-containing protein [Clostridium beijerinckii]|uniref:DNA primase n=1 Tax=Clostridium beijerinckii TaxID=1520 RepID=A0A7X9XQL1_CLOBE|nr:CHC2 zinc finger domain-containing protein [Clostridium beijerinckii]NMF06275.1 DNA primase [Clostridium beijerinckii]